MCSADSFTSRFFPLFSFLVLVFFICHLTAVCILPKCIANCFANSLLFMLGINERVMKIVQCFQLKKDDSETVWVLLTKISGSWQCVHRAEEMFQGHVNIVKDIQ